MTVGWRDEVMEMEEEAFLVFPSYINDISDL
jgi:hypothetical protein